MSFLTLLGVAVGLAMDATAVAVAASIALGKVSSRQVFRFAFHVGLFQALMPAWLMAYRPPPAATRFHQQAL